MKPVWSPQVTVGDLPLEPREEVGCESYREPSISMDSTEEGFNFPFYQLPICFHKAEIKTIRPWTLIPITRVDNVLNFRIRERSSQPYILREGNMRENHTIQARTIPKLSRVMVRKVSHHLTLDSLDPFDTTITHSECKNKIPPSSGLHRGDGKPNSLDFWEAFTSHQSYSFEESLLPSIGPPSPFSGQQP